LYNLVFNDYNLFKKNLERNLNVIIESKNYCSISPYSLGDGTRYAIAVILSS